MKTAVSIPHELFEAAQKLARRTGKSRSRVFSDALKEYVARHAPDDVTDAMDRACSRARRSICCYPGSTSSWGGERAALQRPLGAELLGAAGLDLDDALGRKAERGEPAFHATA